MNTRCKAEGLRSSAGAFISPSRSRRSATTRCRCGSRPTCRRISKYPSSPKKENRRGREKAQVKGPVLGRARAFLVSASWGSKCTGHVIRLTKNRRSKSGSKPARSGVARHAKAVVRILKRRIQRAARGAAAEFHLVAPRSAAGGFARAGRRADRVALGRAVVIIRGVKIAAPLVHARAHVVEFEAVRFMEADGRRPAVQCIHAWAGAFLGKLIAPGIFPTFEAAARRAFPFRLGRQTKRCAPAAAAPRAISRRLVPRDADDGLVRVGEHGVLPKRRWRRAGRGNVIVILAIRHGEFSQCKRVDIDAMRRFLVVHAVFAAHEKSARGNDDRRGNKFVFLRRHVKRS